MTPQHMHALAFANEIRLGVAEFVRDTRGLQGRESATVLADVFERDYDDRILGAAKVRRLLRAVPRLYPMRAEKMLLLASCSKNHEVKLRDLTERQRTVIAAQLRLWAAGYGS